MGSTWAAPGTENPAPVAWLTGFLRATVVPTTCGKWIRSSAAVPLTTAIARSCAHQNAMRSSFDGHSDPPAVWIISVVCICVLGGCVAAVACARKLGRSQAREPPVELVYVSAEDGVGAR